MELTAMTFNLRMDTSEDGDNAWLYRKDKVVQMIHAHQPTVIGTQEGLHHMVEYIEGSLTTYGKIGQGREGGQNGEYNALFYNKNQLSLIDHGQFWLSETSDIPNSSSWDSACPRICTWGKFTLVDDRTQTIVVFNTHLDHVSQLARGKGMALIGSKIKTYMSEGIPTILMGDFNIVPDNPVVRYVRNLGLKETQTVGGTFHGFDGRDEGEPIDYIFISESMTVIKSMIDQQTIEGRYPSDHYPVISQLALQK